MMPYLETHWENIKPLSAVKSAFNQMSRKNQLSPETVKILKLIKVSINS